MCPILCSSYWLFLTPFPFTFIIYYLKGLILPSFYFVQWHNNFLFFFCTPPTCGQQVFFPVTLSEPWNTLTVWLYWSSTVGDGDGCLSLCFQMAWDQYMGCDSQLTGYLAFEVKRCSSLVSVPSLTVLKGTAGWYLVRESCKVSELKNIWAEVCCLNLHLTLISQRVLYFQHLGVPGLTEMSQLPLASVEF